MRNKRRKKAAPAGRGFPWGNRVFHLFLLLLLLPGGLRGQEASSREGAFPGEDGFPPGAASETAEGSSPGTSSWEKGAEPAEGEGGDREDQVYFIREIFFNIQGRTKPFALFNRGEFEAGEEIRGETNLIRYLAHKTQLLINQRALEEVSIEDRRDEAGEDGRIPVDLHITTRDTWNFIILPRPQLDNNEGFDLSLKIRDYNFLGSLSPLRIDIGYQLDNEYVDSGFFSNLDRGKFNFIIDSEIPFRALGLDWNINFDHIFGYTLGEPVSYKNITGISVEYPYKTTTFTFGFEQNVSFYEENEDRFKSQYGKYFDGEYLASELYTAWEIPLGYEIGEFGGLIYTPRISAGINYRPWGNLDYPRESPKAVFSHKFGFDKIDWMADYRRGFDVSVENTNELNFGRIDDDGFRDAWDNRVSVTAIAHWPFFSFLGLSSRLRYHQRLNPRIYNDKAGDVLRGIIDRDLSAQYMLSFNLDIPVRILRFVPSEWFHSPKLRLFDFELHASPFIDAALAKDTVHGVSFTPGDLLAAGGFEIIFFPYFFRSLYVRLSLGFSLQGTDKLKGNSREYFIGIGHAY